MIFQQTLESRRQFTSRKSSLKTVVVATDFSPKADAALNWAVELAGAHNARVVLAHAIESELPALAEAHGPIAAHVKHKLDAIQANLTARKVEVQTAFDAGAPWRVIAKIAKDANADLIVVGAHGQSTLSERVLGTVADRLVKSTSTPVIVHRSAGPKTGNNLRTILAATDFSEEAALALSAAVRLLHSSVDPARIVLFHTVALALNYGEFETPMTVPHYWDECEHIALRQLESLAAPLRSDRLQVDVKTFRGFPVESILHEAQMVNADLIAIGTVGRTGMNRFFMGSVAERILHHAKCPVLTVRKPDQSDAIQLSAD